MKAVIQAAAGPGAGLGHVRRCLALAGALRDTGCEVAFSPEGLEPPRADVLIVDTYQADSASIASARAFAPVVVAIEDLPDRDLPADIVVAVGSDAGHDRLRYPEATECLFGFSFALLDAGFSAPQPVPRAVIQRLLITVGGGDPLNATPRLMQWAAEALPEASQDVVIGPLFQNTDAIEAQAAAQTRVTLRRAPTDLRALMVEVDLAIAGGGQTIIELAACGTPTVAVTLFDNQARQLAALSREGAVFLAGGWDDPAVGDRVRAALTTLADPGERIAIGTRARGLIDGQGARRVAEAIVRRLRTAKR